MSNTAYELRTARACRAGQSRLDAMVDDDSEHHTIRRALRERSDAEQAAEDRAERLEMRRGL